MAVENDRVAVVKLLLDRGADAHAISNVRVISHTDINMYHNSDVSNALSNQPYFFDVSILRVNIVRRTAGVL